jgi:PAP2 superfamily
LHLPLRFDWTVLATTFWLVLAAQSIFVTVLLLFIGFPVKTFAPVLQRLGRDKSRMAMVLAYFLILWWSFTWVKALVLTVDTIAVIELRERLNLRDLRKAVLAVLWPALYLFAGFLLIFAYNDVIASVRFSFANDAAFNSIDRRLLHGTSVSDLSHWAIGTFPISFFHFLEFIYFGMFTQVGAALILTSLCYGKSRGLQFVGTVLTAYCIALIVFSVWPSQGPYYLCAEHFSRFPSTLQAYTIEKVLITKALARWNHQPMSRISTDYYIAFPCMHITQPLIVMWFLRRWKRIVAVLVAYDVLLVIAIVLLEWHYFVDILAAVPVAGIAIAITDFSGLRNWWRRNEIENVPTWLGTASL